MSTTTTDIQTIRIYSPEGAPSYVKDGGFTVDESTAATHVAAGDRWADDAAFLLTVATGDRPQGFRVSDEGYDEDEGADFVDYENVPDLNEADADEVLAYLRDSDDADLVDLGAAFAKRVASGPTYWRFAFASDDDEHDDHEDATDMHGAGEAAETWAQDNYRRVGASPGETVAVVVRPQCWEAGGPTLTVAVRIAGVESIRFVNGHNCGSGFDVYAYRDGDRAAALVRFKDGSGQDDVYADLSGLNDMDDVGAVCRNFANGGYIPDESKDGAEDVWDELHAAHAAQS